MFAFVVGFASTFSCGGGSSSNAADYAPIVHEHAASDITTGELDISLIPSHLHSASDLVSGTVPAGRMSGTYDISITGNSATATVANSANSVDGISGQDLSDMMGAVCKLYYLNVFTLPGTVDCDDYLNLNTVFVTSTQYDGNLGGLAGADAICQSAASSAGLAGSYMAWLSSSTQSPDDTFTKSAYPYVLPDRTIVATDWNDLTDGTILNVIEIDEYGSTIPGAKTVWTFTNQDGTAQATGNNCSDWTNTSGAQTGGTGRADFTDNRWTDSGSATCSSPWRLFCFEQ